MSLFDIFSKRQKRLRNEVPDVYQYDVLPNPLRTQFVLILTAILGDQDHYTYHPSVREVYDLIVDTLRREYGVFLLPPTTSQYGITKQKELFDFILNAGTESVLDALELSARLVNHFIRDNYNYLERRDNETLADDTINEINHRFKEHGVGYQFDGDEIIRVDSQLIHSEVVKPALTLLNANLYKGANQEFLSAHEHYRRGKNKEAMNDCLKSFESVMKAICDKRGWQYNQNDTAKKLIDVLYANNLVPLFWQSQLSSLRSLLESSVPTGRNRLSGHGQGSSPVNIPNYVAAFLLHMTASTIVFLVKAEEAIP